MATRTNKEPGMPREVKERANGSGKWSKYRAKRAGLACSWADLDASLILDALVSVVDHGDAILLGSTRDGGTLVVTVISGDERLKLYGTTATQMADELTDLIATYTGD